MHIGPAKITLAALALLGSATAHTTFSVLYVDGQNQGDGVCIRMDMNGETCNSPIAGLQSPEMACGRNGEKGVARVCPAKAGSTLTFEYRQYPDASQPGALDPGHKGPCAVYMKKVESAKADNNAAGDGWFKIWDEGYDEAAGKWCTNKMIDNNGHLSITVPSDIEGGYYLVRPELLALHSAANNPPDPQFYVNCAQVYIESSGTAKPATVTIPENYVDISMPGMTYNVYNQPLALPYPLFGPPAYQSGGSQNPPSGSSTSASAEAPSSPASSKAAADSGASGSTAPADTDDSECLADDDSDADYSAPDTSTTTGSTPTSSPVASSPGDSSSSDSGQIEGQKPEGCIMVNANWCGFEVKSYTDENGCWDSSSDCWTQSKACFDQAPPTGAKNCDLWNDKCNHLDDTCNAKDFTGPPDAGKDLTPTPPDLGATASRKLMALVKKHESHVMKRAYRARSE